MKAKRAVLLCKIGSAAYKVAEDLNAPTALSDDAVTFDMLMEQLRGYYYKKPSLLVARTEFARIRQKEGQSSVSFAVDLRNQAARCEFGGELQTRLRDQFVAGLRDESIRKRLLVKEDISIEEAEKKAADYERVEQENKTVLTVHHVLQVERSSNSHQKAESVAGKSQWYGTNLNTKFTADSVSRCSHCGNSNHVSDQWFYKLRGWKCRACNMAIHKASMCKAKSKQTVRNEKQQRHLEATDEPNETDETVKEVNTGIRCETNSEFEFDVRLNGVPLRMEQDTGAEASVAPRSVWVLLGRPKLHTGPRLKAYGGSSLPNLGQAEVKVEFRGVHKRLWITFLESDNAVSLFGLPWIRAFDAIQLRSVSTVPGVSELFMEFEDLFDSRTLGTVRGYNAHLYFKPDAHFKLNKPRPLPLALNHRVEAELERLVSIGVLTPVDRAEFSTTLVVAVLKPKGAV